VICRPADPDELQGWLAARDRSVPLLITGNDAPAARARAEQEGADVISTAGLDGPIDYRPDDLTITVGAGMRVTRLVRLVTERGQWLPTGGAEAEVRSVGGWIATAPPGPFDHAYGPVGRQLLACRVQAPDGGRYRWGRAVVKNVAGYSMARLMCGSRGRLGVLTAASLRVWPRPRTSVCCRIAGGPDLAGMLAAGSLPIPGGDPEGALWVAGAEDTGWLMVWLHGSERSTTTRASGLARWASDCGYRFEQSAGATEKTSDASDRLRGGTSDSMGERAPETSDSRSERRFERRFENASFRLTTGRRYVVDGIRRIRETFGTQVRQVEALPILGLVSFQVERAGDSDPDTVARLLGLYPSLGPGLVERGGAADLAAAEHRRAAGVRRTEASVIAALGGQPRHWLGDYL